MGRFDKEIIKSYIVGEEFLGRKILKRTYCGGDSLNIIPEFFTLHLEVKNLDKINSEIAREKVSLKITTLIDPTFTSYVKAQFVIGKGELATGKFDDRLFKTETALVKYETWEFSEERFEGLEEVGIKRVNELIESKKKYVEMKKKKAEEQAASSPESEEKNR